MKTLSGTVIVVIAIAAAAGGCANHRLPVSAQGQGKEKLTLSQRSFDASWQASLEVLRGYHFRIDRTDPRAGVITTRPMLARHWFEFWRRDAACVYDLAEGTLQSVYRRVIVRIRPTPDGAGLYMASVSVEVSRANRQEMEIVGASEAYTQFLDSVEEDEYLRHRRRKRLKRQASRRRKLEGDLGAEPPPTRPADTVVSRDTRDALARKLAAEISDAAAERLAKTH